MAGTIVRSDRLRLYIGLKDDFAAQYAGATTLTKAIADAIVPIITAPPAQAGAPDYKIGNINEIGEQTVEVSEEETTALDSKGKDYESGLPDGGTQSLTINLVGIEKWDNLDAWLHNGAKLVVAETFHDQNGNTGASMMYEGFIQSLGYPQGSLNGVWQANANIRVSGQRQRIADVVPNDPAGTQPVNPHTINDPLS